MMHVRRMRARISWPQCLGGLTRVRAGGPSMRKWVHGAVKMQATKVVEDDRGKNQPPPSVRAEPVG